MSFRDKLVADLANREAARICRRVIRTLQGMKDLLSGDDSGLVNTWNEVCAQIQAEQSAPWDAYEETILAVISKEVDKVPTLTRQALWLQTDPGQDWAFEADEGDGENDSGRRESESPPFVDEEIVHYICREYVLSKAADWTNAAIRQFLEREPEPD